MQVNANATAPGKGPKGLTTAQALKQRQAINSGQMPPGGQPVRPEDKPDSPEYKKKQAMIKGPVLELTQESQTAYGMPESTFTALKDVFQALIESNTRTGVLSPQRFLDIFKRDNEMFRNSMHQDAHEFYGLVLNDVISNVEDNAKLVHNREESMNRDALAQSLQSALGATAALKSPSGAARSPGTGWVHDIFEGVLTSETRCLTCETASQREETFLDLSIDLEEHSSVTSCLQKFSAEEMLCERNKFHCDHCGGLQEAEKRMKVKKLPKVLALHLKRFKYTEDYSRLQKLFHRVVYPYYLRMFNTSDDAEDADRIYELYAVVVHIGGNAYHGHYVSVIKTKDRGWLLFDDEMVEPVDKHFVRNFFGDKPGMACAYVLFYQETTFEKMREEQDAEGLEEVRLASQTADLGLDSQGVTSAPLSKLHTAQPVSHAAEDHDAMPALSHALTAPVEAPSAEASAAVPIPPVPVVTVPVTPVPAPAPPAPPVVAAKAEEVAVAAAVPAAVAAAAPPAVQELPRKSKEDKSRDKKEQKAAEKEQKAAEKARKVAEKEQAKQADKERLERQARAREAQKTEQDQLQKILQESKEMAKDEEKKRKDEAGPNGDASQKSPGFLSRANRGSKSMSRKSLAFLGKDKTDKTDKMDTIGDTSSVSIDGAQQNGHNGHNGTAPATNPEKQDKPLKDRFSFGLGRKKSEKVLS